MFTHRVEQQSVVVVEEVICDCCGESCAVEIWDGEKELECATLSESWGYHHGDRGSRRHDLCQKCVDKIVATFKHEAEYE